jgi:hypothetical protein
MVVSLLVSIYVLKENVKEPSYQSFFAFGLCIAIWEITAFLHRNAPGPELSELFLRIDILFTIIAQQFLLLTILNIRGWNRLYLAIFSPLAVVLPSFFLVRFKLYYTVYGWSYIILEDPISLVNLWFFYIYVIAILITLVVLIWRFPTLRNKFMVIMSGYLIYIAIILVVNLIIFPTNPDFPPLGGIVSLLMFLFIAYSFKLKTPLRAMITPTRTKIGESLSFFLTEVFNSLPGEIFGRKIFEFNNFLDESGLGSTARLEKDKLIILRGELDKRDINELSQLIFNILSYLEEKRWDPKLVESFVCVINTVYSELECLRGKEAAQLFLKSIIEKHGHFLKLTDALYGLANGAALDFIEKDESLDAEDDWKATLRIYKRLLFATLQDFYATVGEELFKRALTYDLIRYVNFEGLRFAGVLSTERLERILEELPVNERIRRLKESYNAFIAWLIDSIISTPQLESVVERFRRVFHLNIHKVRELNVQQSLLEVIVSSLPEKLAKSFCLIEGFTERDAVRFSSKIGFSPQQLLGCGVLFKFDPDKHYERVVNDFLIENLAYGRLCCIFTRRNSRIHRISMNKRDVSIFLLSPITSKIQKTSEAETVLPVTDLSGILGIVQEKSSEGKNPIAIIFDSLSDIVLMVGFEAAYKFTRHLIDMISMLKIPALFLINEKAHRKEVVSAFEGLFEVLYVQSRKSPP